MILALGRQTVSSALRTMGLDQEKRLHCYHRVLSRARWSSTKASRALLGLLVETLVPEGDPLVVSIDETRTMVRKCRTSKLRFRALLSEGVSDMCFEWTAAG